MVPLHRLVPFELEEEGGLVAESNIPFVLVDVAGGAIAGKERLRPNLQKTIEIKFYMNPIRVENETCLLCTVLYS